MTGSVVLETERLRLSTWGDAAVRAPHFIGFAHTENKASRAVLEHIGMTPTHEGIIADMPHQFYIKHRTA